MSKLVHEGFHSAVLKRIEWDNGILSVTFNNDKVFKYQVPDVNIYYELAGSASIGSYYSKNVKGKFPVVPELSQQQNTDTMIKLQVIGNLGKDCIVKEVNGKNVINFSVAHTERYKDTQGNQKEKTTWVECAYWTDKTAISPYLLKGTMVYVEGQPEADAYTNKEGTAAATLRCRVGMIQLLGGKKEEGTAAAAPAAAGTTAAPVAAAGGGGAPVDDLPF